MVNCSELGIGKRDEIELTSPLRISRQLTRNRDKISHWLINYHQLVNDFLSQTAGKVNTLCAFRDIEKVTYKWLNLGQDPPRIPEYYTLTKIHKPVTLTSRRPIFSGSGGPTERISSFVDSLLQP